MLAELGYTALAVDMFGDGKQANHPEDAQKFAGAIFSNVKMGEDRFLAAYDFLKKQDTVDPEKMALIQEIFKIGKVFIGEKTCRPGINEAESLFCADFDNICHLQNLHGMSGLHSNLQGGSGHRGLWFCRQVCRHRCLVGQSGSLIPCNTMT